METKDTVMSTFNRTDTNEPSTSFNLDAFAEGKQTKNASINKSKLPNLTQNSLMQSQIMSSSR